MLPQQPLGKFNDVYVSLEIDLLLLNSLNESKIAFSITFLSKILKSIRSSGLQQHLSKAAPKNTSVFWFLVLD